MTPIHWAWSAIAADAGIFFTPWIHSTSSASFMAVLGGHASASLMVAACIVPMLPQRYRGRKPWLMCLLFSFAFVAPVIGALGLLILTRVTMQEQHQQLPRATPVTVELPRYDVQSKSPTRTGQGAIRSRLDTSVPGNIRMRSLLSLQAVPNRVANPILEDLLSDSMDDIRLVAFGMLDAEEKKISRLIQAERDNLARDLSAEHRYTCLQHLAELHWELIYASLAQGELKRHILGMARRFVEEALATGVPPTAGLVFLQGRIHLAQGDVTQAQQCIQQAIALGQPRESAMPYLAELAFRRREFGLVKAYMQQLVALNIATKTRAIADFWTGRDQASEFNDRRIFPHI